MYHNCNRGHKGHRAHWKQTPAISLSEASDRNDFVRGAVSQTLEFTDYADSINGELVDVARDVSTSTHYRELRFFLGRDGKQKHQKLRLRYSVEAPEEERDLPETICSKIVRGLSDYGVESRYKINQRKSEFSMERLENLQVPEEDRTKLGKIFERV